MANEKNAKKVPQMEQQKKPSASAVVEETHDMIEFAAAADVLFGTVPECVVAAFKCEGVEKATKKEAERIVSAFLKKEV